MSKHLALPCYVETFERKKTGGGGFKPRDDSKQFSKVQLYKLTSIKDDFHKEKDRLKPFFEPNLIFKLELKQKVEEQSFIEFLKRNGVRVIAPSPSGTGYWVILAEDEDMTELTRRLLEYGEKEKYKEFHAIDSFDNIPPEEKIGDHLKQFPLQEGQETYLDIEIWRMENSRLEGFLEGFRSLIASQNGIVTDQVISENLCLLRVKITPMTFHEIIQLREITRVDRPPKPYITFSMLSIPYEELTVGPPPSENAVAIAVLDSGILSNHPLIENSIADQKAFALLHSDKIVPDKPSDDVGHGTKVSGVALYGDIKECIQNKSFNPQLWILSAKIMYSEENPITGEIESKYDESELLEHQLEKAVTWAINYYPNCKIINISVGNKYNKMFGNKRQFPLATLIDDLSNKLNVIFVVSSGNISPDVLSTSYPDSYPNYLFEGNEGTKIIDPASSAYAITVGSITQEFGPYNRATGQLSFSPAQTHYPSPFSCAGPGYKEMIKPELVEEGGNIIYTPSDVSKLPNIGGELILLNPSWITDGRLFTVDHGTSFSAPKVAHHIGILCNSFPNYSPNLIKALLLVAADIPDDRPDALSGISYNSSDSELMKLFNVYGYGIPDVIKSLSSESNRVLLLAENKIKLDSIHLYYFHLPKEFIDFTGERQLAVSLVYNPPIRRNRIDYMGVNIEYHLFANSTIDEIKSNYKSIQISADSEDIVPEQLKLRKIDLHPGVRTRKRGIHQKGIRTYLIKPQIDVTKPIVLSVVAQNKWISDVEYLQEYAVVLMVKHRANIDLYNQIKHQVEIEQRVRIRPS